MKLTIALASLVVVALSTFLVACNRQSTQIIEQGSGVVAFPDAGVSLEVGEGWNRIDISPGPPICPPTLVGKHGIVRATLFAPDRSDLEKAASGVRAVYDADAEAVKVWFREEEFTTDSGLHGLYVASARQYEKEGRVVEARSHDYIVLNRDSRCVSINYIAEAATDSDVVHQMIRKSLRLQ
jgi:hypothetical protein